jgi:hypothetical protein
MPGRKKLRREIYRTDFDMIERQASVLERAVNHASIGMDHYTAHGQAMMRLRQELRTAINVLGNRPVGYIRPDCHMTPAQAAWHAEVERAGRASLPQEGGEDIDDHSPNDR